MTKDKFQMLCERVLIPQLGDLIHKQLIELHESLDIVVRELARIAERLEKFVDHSR